MKKLKQEPVPPMLCRVCFMGTPPSSNNNGSKVSDPDQIMLACRQCKLSCHRICYNSQLPNGEFLCDYCQELASNARSSPAKLCFLCKGNQYLLKRVGDQGFAHPICLLESPSFAVRSYRSLEFDVGDYVQSTGSKHYCVLCERSG